MKNPAIQFWASPHGGSITITPVDVLREDNEEAFTYVPTSGQFGRMRKTSALRLIRTPEEAKKAACDAIYEVFRNLTKTNSPA